MCETYELDQGVVFGVSSALLLIGAAVLFGGHILTFLDPLGILIVVGGTFGATFANFSLYDLKHARQAFTTVFFTKLYHPIERIQYMVSLAHLIKKNGLLVLEQEATMVDDQFLRLALELTVDSQPQADVKRVLETEMRITQEKAMRAVQVFETLATYAPAMGLIGTLIGLIHMLGTLNDPTKVGPAMALALVATFYGALLSNIVFLPIAGRLRNRSEEEIMVKAITLEGVLSLSKQESPIIVEQRLQGFLPLAQGA